METSAGMSIAARPDALAHLLYSSDKKEKQTNKHDNGK